jgi:hypothetical protein
LANLRLKLAKMWLKMWLNFEHKWENLLIYAWNHHIVTTFMKFIMKHPVF